MTQFLPEAVAILKTFDRFLALFATMIIEQSSEADQRIPVNGGPSLLKQMAGAQSVVVDRRQKLRACLIDQDANEFMRQVTDLAFDMPHFEFSLRHLKENDEYLRLKEKVHIDALRLAIDLKAGTHKNSFAAELKAQK